MARRGLGSRSFRFAAVLLAGLCAGGTAASASSLYGLTVGINHYANVDDDLAGAVADAADIADMLRKAHAEAVVSLTNQNAGKLAVTAAWAHLLARTRRGDTLIFSFAGRGDREDGQDSFLLPGFAADGPGREERLSHQEILAWFKAADEKGVNAIFVGDASFGGKLARAVPLDNIVLRQWPAGTDDDTDASPQPRQSPSGGSTLSENDFSYGLFAYAVDAQGAVPEIAIGGKMRGALSYAFARGLEGHADENGDGQITDAELARYLTLVVPALTEGQQTPRVIPRRSNPHVLLNVSPDISGRIAPLPGDRRLKLKVVGGEAALAGPGVREVTITDDADANLTWHVETGRLDQRLGGLVAEGIDAAAMTPLLSAWTALHWLKGEAALSPAPVSLFSGNQLYRPDALVQIEMRPGRYPYLTLFDLMSDGSAALLSPTDSESAAKDWRRDHLHQMFEAGEEPGAMHRVAILSAKPLPGLQHALAAMQRANSAHGLLVALHESLPDGTRAQIGIFPVYFGEASSDRAQ